jgi:hypothetical protein
VGNLSNNKKRETNTSVAERQNQNDICTSTSHDNQQILKIENGELLV